MWSQGWWGGRVEGGKEGMEVEGWGGGRQSPLSALTVLSLSLCPAPPLGPLWISGCRSGQVVRKSQACFAFLRQAWSPAGPIQC